MSYSNHPVPEGTNVTRENLFKQLLILGFILISLAFISVFVMMKLAAWGASFVPFEYEVQLVEKIGIVRLLSDKPEANTPGSEAFADAEAYLQELANKVAKSKSMPDSMPLTAHLVLDDTVNAFATLGGHLFFYQGLLEKLESENALVMLIGHEVAHIYHRDPIRAASGAILAGLFAEWVTGGSGLGAVFIGDQVARLVMSGFSREKEKAADSFATETLQTIYGHSAGGAQLFEVLLNTSTKDGIASLWSSHPDTRARLEAMPPSIGDIQPLKVDFKKLSSLIIN